MSSNKTKQYISAQYCVKLMSENWCKNIQAILRYSNFCADIFYFASPCKYALDATGRRRPQTPSCADPSLFQRLRRSCSESGLMQRACPMYNDLYWRSIWDIVHGAFQWTNYWTPIIQDGGEPSSWKSTWRHFSAVGGPIWINFRRGAE